MTIGSFRRRRSRGRAPWLIVAFIALGGLTLTTGAAARGTALSPGEISNGTLRLGVNPEGHLDATRRPLVGRSASCTCPTGADALIPRLLVRRVGRRRPTSRLSRVGRPSRTAASRRTSSSGPSTSRPERPTRRSRSVEGSASATSSGRRRDRSSTRSISPSRTSAPPRRTSSIDVRSTGTSRRREFEEFVTIRGAHPRLLARPTTASRT